MDSSYRINTIDDIITPALAYYPSKIRANIRQMIAMAGDASRLWPHVKTYKSAQVVSMLVDASITSCKCATIAEAEMAADCGMKHIVLAYPLVGPAIKRFLALSAAFPAAEFFAIGDDAEQIRLLADAAAAQGRVVPFLLDIDTGLHRTGVSFGTAASLYPALSALQGLQLRGLHMYDGQLHQSSETERHEAVSAEWTDALAFRTAMTARGLDCGIILAGGTPTFPCHTLNDVYLSPGTCVIQDAGYASNYRDMSFEIAGLVLTRVVSHPGPGLFTLDVGCKAIAADPPIPRAVVLDFEDCATVMQNEEHLVLRLPEGQEARRPAIGTLLYAAPWHTCPTTILYPQILAVDNGEIVDVWPVTARDRKITY